MTTINKQAAEVAQNIGKPVYRHYAEKALQTFKKGAILVLDANRYATEGGADPDNIIGVANQDGHNAAADGDDVIQVAIPQKDTWFVMNIGGAVSTAQTQLLKAYGVVKEGNFWHVDTADVTATRVVVEDFVRRADHAAGAAPDAVPNDLNGLVYVSFKTANVLHNNGN